MPKTPKLSPDAAEAALPPATCSAETALRLYRQLEYFREYMPYLLNWNPEKYAATQEAKNTDAALAAYRKETGIVADYPHQNRQTKPRGSD